MSAYLGAVHGVLDGFRQVAALGGGEAGHGDATVLGQVHVVLLRHHPHLLLRSGEAGLGYTS